MTQRTSSRGRGGVYYYVHPVENFTLDSTSRVKHLRIGGSVLATKRSLMQLLRISPAWQALPEDWRKKGGLDAQTFVMTQVRGHPDKVMDFAEQKCREALWVLAGTMLYFSPRSRTRQFGLRGDVSKATSEGTLFSLIDNKAHQRWSHTGTIIPMQLESRWWMYYKNRRLRKFLSVLDDARLSSHWKQTLWGAAALIGRSCVAQSRSEAFLYQMFALDSLLLIRSDSQSATLAKRLGGLLHGHTSPENIEWMYSVRCKVVHGGDHAAVTPEALHLADYYALNTVWNACVHRRLWRTKQHFLEYCSRRARLKRPPSTRLGLRVTWKPFDAKNYELRLP